MDLIKKYFPFIEEEKLSKFEHLHAIYGEWNSKINLISRKDFDFFYERHVLHSLSIAAIMTFPAGTKILDAGTGGGFPGIPLAIFFPQVSFYLVDSIAKKINAVYDIAKKLELQNVKAQCIRVEKLNTTFDYVVSRAVAPLPEMMKLTSHLVHQTNQNDPKPGLLYLKGGDFKDELKQIKWNYYIHYLQEIFSDPFFETKALVHIYKAQKLKIDNG